MQVASILDNIDVGSLALPAFQRGYVWKRPQVKQLMNSLYRGYPVGSLLTWTTRAEHAEVRSTGEVRASGPIELLLDGQQRVTSLYGIIRGKPPLFFDGDAKAFAELYFNVDSEEFEFFSSTRMRNNPLWVSVTELFAPGNSWMSNLVANPSYTSENQNNYLQNGLKVGNIRNFDLPVQSLTGEDKTTEVVVDIFNRVNSGGTRLSKGDLALARICAHWPEGRSEMQERLGKWRDAGFDANLDWLLRCMTGVVANVSEYESLDRIDIGTIQQSLGQTETAVDHLLEAMRSHLYMDTDRVFSSKQALPVIVKYLTDRGGRFPDQGTMVRVLHWYLIVAVWGRFAGPTETVINQDLVALAADDPVEALLRNQRQSQGERVITHENFDVNYSKSRFYPLLYIMSRVHDARDWGTGNQLRHHSLGDHTNLEMHHIFPRAYLRRNGVSANDTNNIGNIAFQTRETNQSIGSRPPMEYMTEIVERWPGTLESQWVPTDPELWRIENYDRFLEQRRLLLANAANRFLDTLQRGVLPPAAEPAACPRTAVVPSVREAPSSIDSQDETTILSELNHFALEQGLAAGHMYYEVVQEDTGELSAVLDLAWPYGLQAEYSEPVAVLLDEDAAVRLVANDAGFRVFTSSESFQRYVEREILTERVQV